MERTINTVFDSGDHAESNGPETTQVTQASSPKRRRPYERMTMTPIEIQSEGVILQGSDTSNDVAVRSQVNVTTFDEDGSWSSDRFDVDFEL